MTGFEEVRHQIDLLEAVERCAGHLLKNHKEIYDALVKVLIIQGVVYIDFWAELTPPDGFIVGLFWLSGSTPKLSNYNIAYRHAMLKAVRTGLGI
jgi:hypothetical protein